MTNGGCGCVCTAQVYSELGASGFEGVLVIGGLHEGASPLRQLWDSVWTIPRKHATHHVPQDACMCTRLHAHCRSCGVCAARICTSTALADRAEQRRATRSGAWTRRFLTQWPRLAHQPRARAASTSSAVARTKDAAAAAAGYDRKFRGDRRACGHSLRVVAAGTGWRVRRRRKCRLLPQQPGVPVQYRHKHLVKALYTVGVVLFRSQ
jgi:hypothetical protein